MPFIPHTQTELEAMLRTIGASSLEDLFSEIPADLKIDELAKIPSTATELEISHLMRDRAEQDGNALCFIGAGAYEHHIPAAVWDIVSRGEFMTAYTPYQAEASQGTLQLIYEYQTMMARLTGMAVSNASLYDGASALAEAVLMAARQSKQDAKRILVAGTVHPHYRDVLNAIVSQQGITVETLPFDPAQGILPTPSTEDAPFAALVIQHPNFFGHCESVDALTDWAHTQDALVIAVVNPTSLALLKEPGAWGSQGADIVCGEGQPLGVPLASGGPYFGFLCCKQDYVRQMPGRLVGRTVDTQGRVGYTLTLQAREQHIRRAKAKSNICTNQGLLVTAGTIYMALLGSHGLRAVAAQCLENTVALLTRLEKISGVTVLFKATPRFHEAVIQLPCAVAPVLNAMAEQGIQAGYSLEKAYPDLGHALLVCVTETKTPAELDRYAAVLEKALLGN